jgi:hypothetical protein
MKSRLPLLLVFSLVSTTLGMAQPQGREYLPREGDIIFQRLGGAPLLETIAGVTKSDYTHCGIVVKDPAGAWKVLEAIGPVREIGLDRWIDAGDRDGFAVYRLKEAHQGNIPAMIAAARKQLGKPYDIRYRFDDKYIYCSELVFKAYKTATGDALGEIKKLGDLNWEPYQDFIRELEQGPVPHEREMITPIHLAMATQLELVVDYEIEAHRQPPEQ